MSFTFVRHGQSQGNATGDYSTATHDTLSELGLEQASCLCRTLGDMTFSTILVSPLTRAMQTIKPYLLAKGRRAEIWPELAEGCWQARELREVSDFPSEPMTLTPELQDHFTFRDGQGIRPCEHESYAEGMYRARVVLGRLVQYHADEDVLLVTHGHMLRELLNLVWGSAQFVRIDHDNCAMSRITHAPDGWTVNFINRRTWPDEAHLR